MHIDTPGKKRWKAHFPVYKNMLKQFRLSIIDLAEILNLILKI